MKRVIWKYKVQPEFKLDLPVDAQVLSVNVQHDRPQMWVLLDAEAPKVERQFISIATGERIGMEPLRYIGTFLIANGMLVFHLFEVRGSNE